MGYSQDQLATAQKQLQDLLDTQGQGINTGYLKSKDYLAGLDAAKATNTKDILGGVASTYGIDPNVSAAGADFSRTLEPRIQAARENQLSQNRMKSLQDHQTKVYNQVYDQYTAAGYDRKQSEAYARQVAQDQSDQAYQAEVAAKGRQFQTQHQDIANQFQDMTTDLNNQAGPNPYEAAMYRALLGAGTAAAGYAIVNGRKVPVKPTSHDISAPVSTQSPYGPQPQTYGPYNPYESR